MSPHGGLSSGLAFLPNWLNEARDAVALEALLSGWVRTSGWRTAGLVWPADGTPTLGMIAKPDSSEKLVHPPAELGEMLRSLRAGSPTVVWQTPGSSGRLYCLLSPTGRPPGLLWAERGPTEPWADADRNYLRLSARLIERSPALTAQLGPTLDPERLQQRLADAAVIAGRMAHDFDNILTGIIGFSDLTVPLLPAGSQAAKYVSEIAKVGQRGIHFTQQLHQLSRSGQGKPHPGSVVQAITKEETRLRPTMPANVQVYNSVPPNMAAVAMEAGPLGLVIGHLLENAADAMPSGGRITVSARAVELSAADVRGFLGQVAPGPHVELIVQDTGPGIKPEVRARLFAEPFYTTKVRRRGLGLAVVYRTLSAHRGGVRIEPVPPPDTGTLARVVIPPAATRPAVLPTLVTTTPVTGG